MQMLTLVQSQDLETRLAEHLKQKHMPDYFLYLGSSGAQNWLNLDSSQSFPVAVRLRYLLEENVGNVARHTSADMDLMSLGVGSGEKERILLQAMMQKGSPHYFAVDISEPLVEAALATVSDIDLEKTGVVAFTEDLPKLREMWNPPVLLALMGNNFCNYDPDYLLSLVHDQLSPGDLFLFDAHLLPQSGKLGTGQEQVEQIYRSPENVLFNIGPLVQRGLDPKCCDFHLDLISIETATGPVQRTSKCINILEDSTVSCGSNKIRFAKGDTITLGFTYKYRLDQIRFYLDKHKLAEVQFFADSKEENLLILAAKRT